MYAVSARRTMASARFHDAPEMPKTVNIIELRRQREAELIERRTEEAKRSLAVLKAQQEIARQAIERANARLREINETGYISFPVILARLSKATGVSQREIMSPRRAKHISFARQAVAYWACRLTKLSLPEIGRRLDIDHTTVIHAMRVYPVKRAAMGRKLRVVR